MHKFSIENKLKSNLAKLVKRDRATYEAVIKKIDEILGCEDINHYKNLRSPLQEFKRVHVKGPFVLTFKYILPEERIVFYDFDHHDKIYSK